MSFAKRAPVRAKPLVSVLLAALLLSGTAMHVRASPHIPAALTADEIALRVNERNVAQAVALKAYISRRVMTLTYKGLFGTKQAAEVVDVSFTAPATKKFSVLSSSGSSLLRESVFEREMRMEAATVMDVKARQESAFTPANYAFRLVKEEMLPQGPCYVLEVTPKTQSVYGYAGTVWVQSTDFAIVRIQAKPAEDPSFWVRDGEFTSEFEKVGSFWLPRKTVSSSRVRLGGHATFTMEFGSYRAVEAAPMAAVETR